MNCKDIESIIYLFDESDEEQRANLRKHLEECSECGAKFQSVISTAQLVKEAFPLTYAAFPSAIRSRIMSCVAEESAKSHAGWLNQIVWMPSVRLAFACVSIFIIGMFLHELAATPAQPASPALTDLSGQVRTRETIKTLHSLRQGRDSSLLRNLKRQHLSLNN